MKVKAIVFDFDETLLDGKKEISAKNRQSIKQLQEGVKVLFATGRNDVYVRNIAETLGNVEAIIACNGALARRVSDWYRLFSQPITSVVAEEMLVFGLLNKLDFTMSFDGAMICAKDSKREQDFINYNAKQPAHLQMKSRWFESAADISGQEVFKMDSQQRESFYGRFGGGKNYKLFSRRRAESIFKLPECPKGLL